jgi:hypothetical protein
MIQINLPAPQTPPVPDFTIVTDADGTSYALRFVWSETGSYWYVRVLDETVQTVLMAARRVVGNTPLFRTSPAVRTPPGYFLVYDTTGQGLPPTLTSLGDTSILVYVTEAELAALGIGGV